MEKPTAHLEGVEHSFLYLAVFLAPFEPLRFTDLFFTVSDLFFCVSFALLLLGGRLPRSPLGRATSLWWFAFLLLMFGLLGSSFVNGDPARGLIVISQYLFAYTMLLFVIVRDDQAIVERMLKLFVISILLIDLHGILVFYTIGYSPGPGKEVVTGAGRLATILGNPNLAASMNALMLPMLLHLWQSAKFSAIVIVSMLAVVGVTVILTSSNSGLLALAFSLVVFVASVMSVRLLLRIAVLVVAVGTLFYFEGADLLPRAFNQRVLSAFEEGDVGQAGTFLDRWALIKEAMAVISERGIVLLGLGADQFRLLSVLGAPVHHVYLLVWVEGGMVALIGWLLFFVIGIVIGLKARRSVEASAGATLVSICAVFLLIANFNAHMYARYWVTPLMLSLAMAMVQLRKAPRHRIELA